MIQQSFFFVKFKTSSMIIKLQSMKNKIFDSLPLQDFKSCKIFIIFCAAPPVKFLLAL